MSDFLKEFLRDVPPPAPGHGRRRVFLSAFGKHPGWDDHMEDFGLETDSQITAKRLLYVEGIKRLIDGGDWKKLAAEECLPRFNHALLWQRERQWILGRLWFSRDGKGRDEYPMAAWIHGMDLPISWAMETLWPRLRQVRKACQAATSATEVQETIRQAGRELQEMVDQACQTAPAPEVTSRAREKFLASPEWGADSSKLLPVLYHARTHLSAYVPGQKALAPGTSLGRPKGLGAVGEPVLRPQSLRLPACGDSPGEVLLQWADFFGALLDRGAPVLIEQYLDGDWVDVIVGEPSSREFFTLRAGTKIIPLVSDVPYTLDEPARQSAFAFIEQYRQALLLAGRGTRRRAVPAWAAIVATATAVLLLMAGYLRFSPTRYLPVWVHDVARGIGNRALGPSPQP